MKHFILLIFACMLCFHTTAQDSTLSRLIFLRHAEKARDGTVDPPLSEEGKQRAARLAFFLKDVPVDALYSTPYKRTSETLAALATDRHLSVTHYDPADAAALTTMMSAGKGRSIVVAGHSNTIPAMVNSLLKNNIYPDIAEDDFGNVWVLLLRGNVVVDCVLYHY